MYYKVLHTKEEHMNTISFRLNDKDDALIRQYAKMHNMDLSSFIRQALIEKIEDEHDLAFFNQVWEEEKNKETITHEQVKKELGL